MVEDLRKLIGCFLVLLTTFACASGQTNTKQPETTTPKPLVTQIDESTIKDVLKPNQNPLFINFWATWCAPCREEFPDIVKLGKEYAGKIDFRTISLDDPIEKAREVPKFLVEMNADFPTFLLYTSDENTVINSISEEWKGGLPFSALYDTNGKLVYIKLGRFSPAVLRNEFDKLLPAKTKKKKIEECDPDAEITFKKPETNK